MRIILICLLLAGCATPGMYPNNIGNGHPIKHTPNPKVKHGFVEIEYKPYELVRQEELTRIEDRKITGTRRDELLNSLPPGGMIVIELKRLTIGAANTAVFEYALFSGGQEVQRLHGRDQIANVPRNDILWSNVDVFPINQNIRPPFTFYVFDGLGGRDTFVID